MELLGKIILLIHIIVGVSTLITGPIAIFYNFKDPKNHRLAGKAFFYAMLVVVFSAVGGFLKHPDSAFFQFLLGISVLVLCGILRGVRAIFMMKGGAVTKFEWLYTALLAINSLWMLGMSAFHFNRGTMVAIPILFGVFGMMSLREVQENWRTFRRPELLSRIDWMSLHTRTMLGAFTASTTAFTVNAAHFLPWWAQWFGPTLLIIPVQIYFGRKFKQMQLARKVA
jgi:hypothetical protein